MSPRLFRNFLDVIYCGVYHELPYYHNNQEISFYTDLNLSDNLSIEHYGYTQASVKQKNLNRNIPILEAERKSRGLSFLLLYTLLDAYIKTDQMEKAEGCYKEGFERLLPYLVEEKRPEPFTGVVNLLYLIGLKSSQAKDFETTSLICQVGLIWEPDSAHFNYLAGAMLTDLGLALGAIAYFEKCLQIGRTMKYSMVATGQYLLGKLPAYAIGCNQLKLGNKEAALEAFKLALKFDPSFEAASNQIRALEIGPDNDDQEKQAHSLLRDGEYEVAIAIYEVEIAELNESLNQSQSPESDQLQLELKTRLYRNYAYSGLAMLFQGQEQEAQMTWMYAVDGLTELETEQFCRELVIILTAEASYQETLGNWSNSWLLYRYTCENAPTLENWLRSLQASLHAVASVSDEQLDWEALTQSMTLLTEQKFVISKELIPLVFTVLEKLRSQYPETYENFDGETYYFMGLLYRREVKIYEAIAEFQRAVNLAPERLEIYENLIESIIVLTNSGSQVYGDWRQVTEIYVQACHELSKLSSQLSDRFHLASTTSRLKSYLMSGMYEAALVYFGELETQIYENAEYLTAKDWKALYVGMLFFVPFLRDDPKLNGQLFEFIADQYRQFCLNSFFEQHPKFQLIPKFDSLDQPETDLPKTDLPKTDDSAPKRSLRIGIMSGLFRRHSVAWCSKDWLFELAKIAPDLKFYLTAQFPSDDITQQYERFGDRLYKMKSTSEDEQIVEMIQQLIDDDLDILIEADSMMNYLHAPIMAVKPAKHCISWAGFAAPYLSQSNYFLGDRHLFMPEVQSYFVEKLLRMPDSYVAMSELASIPIDREAVRQSMGIGADQVVYLSISAGHKFNPDTADAIAQILHRVPDSVFLHKGKGDAAIIKEIYQQACDRYHVNSDRIKFLRPRTDTEEEHRSTYQLADVLLDSYAYNSCTHSLEAFWQDLPVVTIVGKQMFSRFGYSFFQTLGLQDGIAWNWAEYVEWGERFGKDSDLRESVRSHLQRAKQPETLSPLWNPRKFAKDLYDLLMKL